MAIGKNGTKIKIIYLKIKEYRNYKQFLCSRQQFLYFEQWELINNSSK